MSLIRSGFVIIAVTVFLQATAFAGGSHPSRTQTEAVDASTGAAAPTGSTGANTGAETIAAAKGDPSLE